MDKGPVDHGGTSRIEFLYADSKYFGRALSFWCLPREVDLESSMFGGSWASRQSVWRRQKYSIALESGLESVSCLGEGWWCAGGGVSVRVVDGGQMKLCCHRDPGILACMLVCSQKAGRRTRMNLGQAAFGRKAELEGSSSYAESTTAPR
mmetsp:Transcript_16986/g.36590  ORF Transcript_16986/g.36590 Transcript_16986/m.36590 type:complete len:150 (-) Transcript_16986:94-543(-)